MKFATIILALIVTSGCATLTEGEKFDREYARQMTRENFYNCRQAYSDAGVIWIGKGTGSRIKRELDISTMRVEMAGKNCRRILGDGWAQ